MISYKDFEPLNPGFFAQAGAAQQAFDSALARANDWIEHQGIEVLNVESVGFGETAPILRTIRVWYRARS